MKLIITNKNKQGAVVHITNDKQRIEAIKQRAKSKGDKVEVQQWNVNIVMEEVSIL